MARTAPTSRREWEWHTRPRHARPGPVEHGLAARCAGLPGARSASAIAALRRGRAARQPAPPPLRQRHERWLLDRYTAEIARRGGETAVEERHRSVPLAVLDHHVVAGQPLTLVGVDGWRWYSHRAGQHRASLRYLCGRDDAGDWAVRVPGTVDTAREAVRWLTPQPVEDARRRGRRVVRQGDVYAVEAPPGGRDDTSRHIVWTDGGETLVDPTGATLARVVVRHEWDPQRRTLYHRESNTRRRHRARRIGFPARFYLQRPYAMGRGGGRGAAAD